MRLLENFFGDIRPDTPLLRQPKNVHHKNRNNQMEQKELFVFHALLAEVYQKAFGEQLTPLSHGKAQTLCLLIHETTGELLDHKMLHSFAAAVIAGDQTAESPSTATLAILAQFAAGDNALGNGRHEMRMGAYAAWYKYRSRALTRLLAA
jgi:hypothetical protein